MLRGKDIQVNVVLGMLGMPMGMRILVGSRKSVRIKECLARVSSAKGAIGDEQTLATQEVNSCPLLEQGHNPFHLTEEVGQP